MNPLQQAKKAVRRRMRAFRGNEKGVVVTELALSLPLLLILFSGILEVSNFLLLNMKAQHTVVTIADLTTRDENITEATIADIFLSAEEIMNPYPVTDQSRVIVSSISQTGGGAPTITWQRAGAGSLSANSDFGAEGANPTIVLDDLDITLRDDETIIVAEYFYAYRPLIFDFLATRTLRKFAFFRPRLGSLQQIQP